MAFVTRMFTSFHDGLKKEFITSHIENHKKIVKIFSILERKKDEMFRTLYICKWSPPVSVVVSFSASYLNL